MINLIREQMITDATAMIDLSNNIVESREGLNHPVVAIMASKSGRTLGDEFDHIFQDAVDFTVMREVAKIARTIIFDSRQALALRPAMKRFTDRPFWKLPFPATILQFTTGISETDFFQIEKDRASETENDKVLAVVLAEYEGTRNAIAYFTSGAIQRVKWQGDSLTTFEDFINPSDPPTAEAWHNKLQLQALGQACLMYLNCQNIAIDRNEKFSRQERRQAERKGKPLPEYYNVTDIKTRRVVKYHYANPQEQTDDEAQEKERSGWEHSYRYTVEPFFRQLSDGRVIIVDRHDRGLKHEHRKEAIKKVPYTPADPRLTN